MQITTKYSIGQEVYFLFKEEKNNYIELHKDTILEIVITENKNFYLMTDYCDEIHEDEIVSIADERMLINKISELFGDNHESKENI